MHSRKQTCRHLNRKVACRVSKHQISGATLISGRVNQRLVLQINDLLIIGLRQAAGPAGQCGSHENAADSDGDSRCGVDGAKNPKDARRMMEKTLLSRWFETFLLYTDLVQPYFDPSICYVFC